MIKPVTSWFERLPLSLLACKKKTTKKPVDLPSADLNAEEVMCDDADTSGETLHFLLSLNDCSVDRGRLDRCCSFKRVYN